MLSVVGLNDLLDEAEELAENRDFGTLLRFLSSQADELVESDLTLTYLHAYSRYMSGDEVSARQIIERAARDNSLTSNSRLIRRVLNLRAIIEVEQGDLGVGERHLLELRRLAEAANDQKYVAFATLNLGISAQIRGDEDTAICELRRAGAAFQRLGDLAALAGCAHNIGMLLREIGMYTKSESQFLHAREYFEAHGSVEELLATDVERSVLLLLAGEPHVAKETIDRALRRAHDLGNRRLIGEALRVEGMVSVNSGLYGASIPTLQNALDIAESNDVPLLKAEVHTLLYWAMRGIGNAAAASQHREAAEGLYIGMGAPARAQRVKDPERIWRSR